MSNRFIEKAFLYLLVFSLLLHAAVFVLLDVFADKPTVARQEPVMVDLQEMPESVQPTAKPDKKPRRLDEKRRRVPREVFPEGKMARDKSATLPKPPTYAVPEQRRGEQSVAQPREGERPQSREPPRVESLVRPDWQREEKLSKLLPSAEKMAKLEENYRKKFESEIAEGEAKFLNTDDFLFGSFLRRFETAVYGIWRYPSEAERLGIEGVTPVKITFNRKGNIEKMEILESSGSRILDDEVLRTLRMVGPIGSFPRGYDKEHFNLIAFFRYDIFRGGSRTLR
ncbi:MAG: TonB family protein [Geobacteraceae bacterium]